MVLVSEKCAQILKCKVSALRDRLNHPAHRARMLAELNGRLVRTTYEDRNGFKKTFAIGGLTQQGADSLMAYGRLPRPFAVCVAAYFYTRHRIKVLETLYAWINGFLASPSISCVRHRTISRRGRRPLLPDGTLGTCGGNHTTNSPQLARRLSVQGDYGTEGNLWGWWWWI